MLEIDYDDLDCDENHCHLYEGRPFTGLARERSPSGGPVAEVPFLGGMTPGAATAWHEPGRVRSVYNYTLNMLHGRATEYAPDGAVVLDAEYEYGICLWRRRYAPGGAVTEDYTIQSIESALEVLAMARTTFIPALLRQATPPPAPQSGSWASTAGSGSSRGSFPTCWLGGC